MRVVIVGAGVFGLSSALALQARGHEVVALEAGEVAGPRAASTDVSKLVRAEYGADEFYTALMERAFEGWARWERRFERPLLHLSGWLCAAGRSMAPGSFEGDSYAALLARGRTPERVDAAEVARRWPAWRGERVVDGFFHAHAGWAESAAVVSALAAWVRADGGEIRVGSPVAAVEVGAEGVVATTVGGDAVAGDAVVVAAGVWTPRLVPALADRLRATGQPIFYLRPADPEAFRPPAFPAWAAEIGRTGWYGFPATADGIVKVSNHGVGWALDADAARTPPEDREAWLRAFLREWIPALADAPLVDTKMCLYCDSFDGDFVIDRAPESARLVVASGGSGHGFKFAPVLGEIAADRVEGVGADAWERFRWRPLGAAGKESARAGVVRMGS